jgi:SGNH domain (fused to AT3 domains)
MRTDRSTTAFYMSPLRAWEFFIGAIVTLLPALPSRTARAIARGIAAALFAVTLFGLRKGSPYPGLNALLEGDSVAAKLDSYSDGEYAHLYNFRTCFYPLGGVFDKACLRLAPDKTNVLLWGDSLAAHYILGLKAAANPDTTNFEQATQPACMPTLNSSKQGIASCVQFARQMQECFLDHHPDVVVIAADWPEYFRRGFDLIIEDLKSSAALIEPSGARVIVLGTAVQFKGWLPAMLLRAHFRGVDAHPDELLLPSIFEIDQKMRAALPNSNSLCVSARGGLSGTSMPIDGRRRHTADR